MHMMRFRKILTSRTICNDTSNVAADIDDGSTREKSEHTANVHVSVKRELKAKVTGSKADRKMSDCEQIIVDHPLRKGGWQCCIAGEGNDISLCRCHGIRCESNGGVGHVGTF